MYGLANIAVEELVTKNFGAEAWLKIKAHAGVQIERFSRMQSYPDEVSFKLMASASEVLGIPMDPLLTSFGEYWVLYVGGGSFGHLFEVAGNSLVKLLQNLDSLHSRVGQNFPELVPPSFRLEHLEGRNYRLHYQSERQGLCPIVVGNLKGLSARFKTPVDVTHPTCQRAGADHCEFHLVIGEPQG